MAKKSKPCPAPSAPGITTDRTIDERGIQKHHSPKLDDYDRRTTPPQEQQIYQKAAEIWIKNEKPKTAAVTGVMSFYNKRLVIKARLLDDPTPIIDTAESVPPNVRSASHFLPQREYIGRAEDRPKINQVVLVRVPPNGSYEVPGTIVEITDEITGPPIRVPKKKKDKSKGAKAAAKGQPAGGIPESPIPGDSTGKKVNPQNQIPKPVDAPPPPPGRRPGGKFEVIQEAVDEYTEGLASVSFLSGYAAKEAEGRAGLQEQRDGALQDFAEEKAKLEEERAKQEREEATRKAKEDEEALKEIFAGQKQAATGLFDDTDEKLEQLNKLEAVDPVDPDASLGSRDTGATIDPLNPILEDPRNHPLVGVDSTGHWLAYGDSKYFGSGNPESAISDSTSSARIRLARIQAVEQGRDFQNVNETLVSSQVRKYLYSGSPASSEPDAPEHATAVAVEVRGHKVATYDWPR